MSMSLILTSYSELEGRKYSDRGSENLDSVELTDDFFTENVGNHVVDIDIWDTTQGPPYQQEAVRNRDIHQIVGGCEASARELMEKLTENSGSSQEREVCFDKITMILNARSLLKKKLTKYADQDNIFVVVG